MQTAQSGRRNAAVAGLGPLDMCAARAELRKAISYLVRSAALQATPTPPPPIRARREKMNAARLSVEGEPRYPLGAGRGNRTLNYVCSAYLVHSERLLL
jgi:hypothetical protein